MDVWAWLRGLGLGQYEATFRESGIDAEVLPALSRYRNDDAKRDGARNFMRRDDLAPRACCRGAKHAV